MKQGIMFNFFKLMFVVFLMFFNFSCDKDFEYSVYSEFIPENEEHTTKKNLERISTQNKNTFSPFKLTLISDSHLYYGDLESAIKTINNSDFVIHCGDLTDNGVEKEYSLAWKILKNIKCPYLTVIGNHDILANGQSIYNKMFGDFNYSFLYKNCLFVFFDDVIWGSTITDPDFTWLNQALDNQTAKYKIVITHIPYWSDQFFLSQSVTFKLIMASNNVDMIINGHHHSSEYKQDTMPSGKIIKSIVVGSVSNRSYKTLSFSEDSLRLETVHF